MDIWTSTQSGSMRSVFLIHTECAEWNYQRPFLHPSDSQSSGSGFCIDARSGLVVTNSHVVGSARSITARSPTITGEKDLRLDLLCTCPTRDLALLRLTDDAMEALGAQGGLEQVVFGDSDELVLTDQVLAVGFPLGQTEIKQTTGVVSGWHCSSSEDAVGAFQNTFVQITAAINPGNSGGPLFNRLGEVVGVNAAGFMFLQNIGFAVPSRVTVSIVAEMMLQAKGVFFAPEIAFTWTPLNATMSEVLGGDDGGVMVTCAQSRCPLQFADVLMEVRCPDAFAHRETDFDPVTVKTPDGRPELRLRIDHYGKCSVVDDGTTDGHPYRMTQKRTLVEALSCLPVGWPLEARVLRRGRPLRLDWEWSVPDPPSVRDQYSCFEEPTYTIEAGMCIVPLNKAVLEAYKRRNPTLCVYDKPEMRYRPLLVVTRVFPQTETSQLHAVEEGMVLASVNGQRVRTLRDVDAAMRHRNDYHVFRIRSGPVVIVDAKRNDVEAQRVCEQLGIKRRRPL